MSSVSTRLVRLMNMVPYFQANPKITYAEAAADLGDMPGNLISKAVSSTENILSELYSRTLVDVNDLPPSLKDLLQQQSEELSQFAG